MFPTVFFYKVSIRGMPAITWETKVFQLAAGTPTATILTASGSTLQTFDPVNTSSRYGGDLFIRKKKKSIIQSAQLSVELIVKLLVQ